ncbi:MAG: hypothetical protein R3E79_58630 [Caldilineaceae bacterium]
MKTKSTTQTKAQPQNPKLAAASTEAPVEQTVETLPPSVSDASQPVTDGGTVAPAACCGVQKQQSCCAPSAKASCCGAPAAPGSCGCK